MLIEVEEVGAGELVPGLGVVVAGADEAVDFCAGFLGAAFAEEEGGFAYKGVDLGTRGAAG